MKCNLQSGLSALQIIIILAILAVAVGLFSTFAGDSNIDPATQNAADTSASESPLEQMADTMAENKTADMMEEVAERNIELEAEITATNQQQNVAVEQSAAVDATPVVTNTPGTFTDYSPDKLSLAENGTVVLFFHASWCPSCRGLENDINASLSDIPTDTHILKLDYDTQTELKRKYGVVRQHTLVVVDSNGNEIKKLTGLTNTLEQVVNQL